ncbi:hypothetical protein [Actinoplanes sichuanensis]|uniref:Uncharacterized protein n=1 Tax=Actinoplanes sichuanensis TaxID=512349 RepID=A0ABW4A5S0_9ACTN|nr:hypothetical protein [Actinoplanes sichuanensis]
MDRREFGERLAEVIEEARRRTAPQIIEDLPEPVTLRVWLNHSYGAPEPARHEINRTPAEAADLLWRDGLVPRWVNVGVAGETGTVTFIDLVCSGDLRPADRDPFHVVGPPLPPSGERPFSIHHTFEVHDATDARRLTEVADRVRFLDIFTDLPVEIPAGVTVLNGWRGSLGACTGPHHLELVAGSGFAVAADELLPVADSLHLVNLPDRPWGMATLRTATPNLTSLTLTAPGGLWVEGPLPAGIRRLTLAGDHLVGTISLPAGLEFLRLEFNEIDLAQIQGDQPIRSVTLRRSPITEEQAVTVVTRWQPDGLDLVDCGLDEALIRIAMLRPGMGLMPGRLYGPQPWSEYDEYVIRLPESDEPEP